MKNKKAKKIQKAGVTLTTVGMALQALFLFKAQVPKSLKELFSVNFAQFVLTYLPIISVLALVVGLLLIIYSYSSVFRKVANEIAFKIERKKYRYIEIQAKKSDLPELYVHYNDLFGEDNIPIEQMESWFDKNDEILWKIIRICRSDHDRKAELIGFYDIEPLTVSGEAKIRRKITGANKLKKGDILSSRSLRSNSNSYYIGSVGSPAKTGLFEKGLTMGLFIKRVSELSAHRTISLYAKPTTVKGIYLVKKLFKMNKRFDGPDSERIWSKEIYAGDLLSQHRDQLKLIEKIEVMP